MPECKKAPATEALKTEYDLIVAQSEAINFLNFIDPTAQKFTFQIFVEKAGTPKDSGRVFNESPPDFLARADALQNSGRGLFFTVNRTDLKGRSKGNIKDVLFFFIDIDFKLFEEISIEQIIERSPFPIHAIVSTGHGYHAYYKAQEGTTPEQFSDAQERLNHFFKDLGADQGVKDISRVLRLPGTFNVKKDPVPVKWIYRNDAPPVAAQTIIDVIPLPETKKPAKPVTRPQFSLNTTIEETEQDWTEQELFDNTTRYVETVAQGTGEGNRNTTLKDLMPFLMGRAQSKFDWVEYWAQLFCSITGLPETEARSMIRTFSAYGAFQKLVPKKLRKKISFKRVQQVVDTGETIEQARDEIYKHIKGLILNPDERYHLLKITTGLGKTTGIAQVLSDLHAQDWPTRADGKPLKVLYLTDSKELLKQFRSELNIDKVQLSLPKIEPITLYGIELYEGRNKDNCSHHERIKDSTQASKYCGQFCPAFSSCAFQHKKLRVLNENIVIAAKAAFLNNSDMLNTFDTVIIDESISEHIYKQITFKRDQLHEVLRAIHYAEISERVNPVSEETEAARAFVQGLLDEINKDGISTRRLKRTVPALSHETIEAIEQFVIEDGEVVQQAKAFFSLFTGNKSTLRATTGPDARINFAARQDKLIATLKQKTVLHLDATPVMAFLKKFEPVIFEKTRPQNAKYYQDVSRSLSKTNLKKNPALNDDVNKQINAIIESTKAAPENICVFTFKYDEAAIKEALPEGVMVGVYGRDGRGSNTFKHCTHFIVKGSYTPNIDAMSDLAYLLNKSHKKQIMIQHREAELLQVIGRARAATSNTEKHFFFLNDNPLPLDSKPEPISAWFENLLPEQKNAETLMPVSLCRSPLYEYIAPTCTSSQPCGIETVLSSGSSILNIESDAPLFELDQVRKSIQNCFDTYGFYSHDLMCFNQNRFNVDQEQLPEGISERKFKKLSVQILKNYPATQLPVDLTARVKVWGDSSKAVDLLTNTEELQQAIAYVRACYHASPLDLVWTLPKVGLSTSQVDPVKLTQEQDFKKLNWCILLYRYHLKNQAEQARPVFRATSEPATALSILECYAPLNPSTPVYPFPWIDPGHEKQTEGGH